MGNRLALIKFETRNRAVWSWTTKEAKILRIVKTDGKVLKYKAPLLVWDLLSIFDGYGVGVSRKGECYLPQDYQLMSGHEYYLLPLRSSSIGGSAGKATDGTKRIKIAVTKQQLRHLLMLNKATLEAVISVVSNKSGRKCLVSSNEWRPRLETILEQAE